MTALQLDGRIAVLGLGRSGEAVVDWALARPGVRTADVVVFAEDDTPRLREAAAALNARGVRVDLGVTEIPEGFSLIVTSPGIAPHRPLLASALHSGVPVISELELAYQVARAPFVAVTGTNGKTTTTALLAHLLQVSGRVAETAGNIGRPAIGVASSVHEEGVIVAECSSFQLAFTLEFHPRVSVLLNLTPDHINWHGSLETYARDKARVFANQTSGDVAVIDMDDPGSAAWAADVAARGVTVVPVQQQGERGARVEDGTLVVDVGSGPVRLVDVGELLIRGTHNVGNALAAAAAALACGATPEGVRSGLRTFAPLEHRLEPVASVDGVAYVNDSKATNPDAVLKALTAFDGHPLVILLGGRNKGNDFAPLARACAARCRLSVLYGEARSELESAFVAAGAAHVVATTMADALAAARLQACSGDTILLSPACASFDEFTGYEDRGRRFVAAVEALPGART